MKAGASRSETLMKRPLTLLIVSGVLLQATTWARPPNVILIMTDDQGYGDMSCHGNPYLQTPNLDRLHAESVRLTDFHVDPTCSPTRAALMTGRYSSRVGVWLTYGGRHHLRADEVTMADVFADAGYRTAIFGKWHLGDNYPFRPQDRGFHESLIHGGGVVGEVPDYWDNDYYDDTYFRNGEPEKVEGYCTDVWFREAMRFAESNKDSPFFIYLPTNAPHGPHHVPEKYVAPYRDKEGVPDYRARFYAMIANIDENLGRLREHLCNLELAENTILVFLTDNGTASGVGWQRTKKGAGSGEFHISGFNAGMRGKKASPYEGGHRAACFLNWPAGGMNEGKDVKPITAHIDLLPTLLDLCQIQSPKDVEFDGTSLVPLLRGDKTEWRDRTLFVHHQGRFGQKIADDRPVKYKDFAVMTDRWRLVGKELYDVAVDPGQRRDVARSNPDVVAELSEAYEAWWSDISPRFDEYCRTVIGSDRQPRTILTCQGWHGETVPYSQQHVRAAVQANGFWDLEVARDGVYQITLRRWPEELDAPIGLEIPPRDWNPQRHETSYKLLGLPSGAIRAKYARLKVGDFDRTQPVGPADIAITFQVELKSGAMNLQTWLTDDNGASWGAYYVYVERLKLEG